MTNVLTLGTFDLIPLIQLGTFLYVLYKLLTSGLAESHKSTNIIGVYFVYATCILSSNLSDIIKPYFYYGNLYTTLSFASVSLAFTYLFSKHPKLRVNEFKYVYLFGFIINNMISLDYLVSASYNNELNLIASSIGLLIIILTLKNIYGFMSNKYYWLLSGLIFAEFLAYMNTFPILKDNDLLYSVLAILMAIVINYFGNSKENKGLLNSSIVYILGFTLKIIFADINIFNQENILIQVALLFILAFVFLYVGLYYRNKNSKKVDKGMVNQMRTNTESQLLNELKVLTKDIAIKNKRIQEDFILLDLSSEMNEEIPERVYSNKFLFLNQLKHLQSEQVPITISRN